jgi:hypothetical protein
MHAVEVPQDTPFRAAYDAFAGLTAVCTDQPEPFHPSANGVRIGRGVGALPAYAPTAIHALFALHDTPAK